MDFGSFNTSVNSFHSPAEVVAAVSGSRVTSQALVVVAVATSSPVNP